MHGGKVGCMFPGKLRRRTAVSQLDGETLRDDLFDDREVSGVKEDRLGHEQVAEQLAALVCRVKTPANVAIYGPWGSGKTGIANLLRARIDGTKLDGEGSLRFVRYDAFKFAEKPLRRNFISATAKELGIEDPKYRGDLYSGRTTTDYSMTAATIWRLIRTFAGVVAVVVVAVAVVALVAAGLADGPFFKDFSDRIGSYLLAGVPAASLLTVLVALAAKQLAVERRTDKADSDEQFEELFEDLVRDSGAARLVVFVDELDRCAPDEVVATLDAVRTFLGVKKCVFVVAADQQVIEEALRSGVPEANPLDTANPYYSVGSAYLDKVFQYQVFVPPLLPYSITRFAADLVQGKAGLWASDFDADYIVSILVPSHVRSPRRVKHLLNAFALEYRLAQRRRAAGILSADPARRADEIARLVCLRVEFPLFARDLLVDHRLPEYVSALTEALSPTARDALQDEVGTLGQDSVPLDDELERVWESFPHASPDARRLARKYAGMKRPVGVVLADADNPVESRRIRGVERAHGQQLVSYLSRTSQVGGPGRDLIYLQDVGSIFGIESDVAERLEALARDRDFVAVKNELDSLPAEERAAALQILISQVRAATGVEAANAATVVLRLLEDPRYEVDDQADHLLGELLPEVNRDTFELSTQIIPGAWRIATASNLRAALDLRRKLLRHPSALEDAGVALTYLREPLAALDADGPRAVEVVVSYLTGDAPELITDVLLEVPDDQLAPLISPATQITTVLKEKLSAWQAAQMEPASARLARLGVAPLVDLSELDPTHTLEVLGEWLSELAGTGHPLSAEHLAGHLLALDDPSVTNTVESALGEGLIFHTSDVAVRALGKGVDGPLVALPTWLAAIDATVLDGATVRSALSRATQELWRDVADGALEAQDARSIATALQNLAAGLADDERLEVARAVLDGVGEVASNDITAQHRLALLRASGFLSEMSVLPRHPYLEMEASALIATLEADCPKQAGTSPLVEYCAAVLQEVRREDVADARPVLDEEATRRLVGAADTCEWLDELGAVRIRLLARVASGIVSTEVEAGLALEDVLRATGQLRGSGWEVAALWLGAFRLGADDISRLLAELPTGPVPADFCAALAARVSALDDGEMSGLLHLRLGDPTVPLPAPELLTALGLQRASGEVVASLVIARNRDAGNNPQREKVLELWQRASVKDDVSRGRLVLKVLIPHLGAGKGAAEQVLARLPSLVPSASSGTKKTLRDAVKRAVHEHGQLADLARKAQERSHLDLGIPHPLISRIRRR